MLRRTVLRPATGCPGAARATLARAFRKSTRARDVARVAHRGQCTQAPAMDFILRTVPLPGGCAAAGSSRIAGYSWAGGAQRARDPPFKFAFFSRLSYWWLIRCACS